MSAAEATIVTQERLERLVDRLSQRSSGVRSIFSLRVAEKLMLGPEIRLIRIVDRPCGDAPETSGFGMHKAVPLDCGDKVPFGKRFHGWHTQQSEIRYRLSLFCSHKSVAILQG